MHDSWMESAGMVRVWARRLRRGWFSTDELFVVGLWGLYQSAEKYDPSRGVKFESFAQPRVRGEMLEWMRTRRNQRCRMLFDEETDDRRFKQIDDRDELSFLKALGIEPVTHPPGPREPMKLSYGGVTLTISGWAKRLGINQSTVRNRVARLGVEGGLSFSMRPPVPCRA